MERFDSCLPQNQPAHALVGGGTTVGLSAMVLAYVLGYRKIHLYGYDSSYREDRSHAYYQFDPQSIPCVSTVAGRSFHTSLAMAKQAELFPQLSDSLIDLGCLITLRGDGLLPWTSKMSTVEPEPLPEKQKYQAMWQHPIYREVSPGEHIADRFVELACITDKDTVIDFGCGTGRGGNRVAELTGCDMTLVDFVNACDQKLTKRFRFVEADLTEQIPVKGKFGFCCDVMEHIPPEDVDLVISNICDCVERVFFQISLIDDACGKLINQRLHLSVHSFHWWRERLSAFGQMLHCEDHETSAIYYPHQFLQKLQKLMRGRDNVAGIFAETISIISPM
jgi:SAM-dependent methyltransferase